MTHIISVSNQKGGVGKTTSSVSLAAQFAVFGLKVLLLDFDPQGSASSGLGIGPLPEGQDVYDMFFGKIPLANVIQSTGITGLDIVPASRDLVGIETELGKTPGREIILKTQLLNNKDRYDLIIIDCPPSSGLLTLNALGASQWVLVPLQAEYYALEGISQLVNTISFVTQTFNPALKILGVFLTMFDARTRLALDVEAEAQKFFGNQMLETRIPRNVRLSEAPSHGQPICVYDSMSVGARAYRDLAAELIVRLDIPLVERRVAVGN